MLAELLLIGKLLGKTVDRSTPSSAVSPKSLFGLNGNGTDRIPKPPTKKGASFRAEEILLSLLEKVVDFVFRTQQAQEAFRKLRDREDE